MGSLADTITRTNLEAAAEVVRQLRLRDIGGIIVIDFIDMDDAKNRRAVTRALNDALAKDRSRTFVVEISPLGLVQMTRQNISDGVREIMTQACPTCGGQGFVVSPETHAIDAERQIRLLLKGTTESPAAVAVHPEVADYLQADGNAVLSDIEEDLVSVNLYNNTFDKVAVVEEFEGLLDCSQEVFSRANVVNGNLRVGVFGHI